VITSFLFANTIADGCVAADREVSSDTDLNAASKSDHSLEDKYIEVMKELQFGKYA
jgi:hypothetical protein